MKNSLARLALAVLLLAVPATAQQVIFSEGFESGLTGWTPTGLWNLEDATDGCGAQAAPYVEGTKAAWYGSPTSCTFDTGSSNSGTLTQDAWMTMPTAPSITLHFWLWSHSEYCWADSYGTQYDVSSVFVLRQTGGQVQIPLCQSIGSQPASTLLSWHERRIDLTQFAGQNIRLQFAFGSGDHLSNGYLGMFVDDIDIRTEPGVRVCPSATLSSGCPCLASNVPVAGGCRNSTLQSATMTSIGSVSVTNDTLQLLVEHMPPNASAILTQSTGTGPSVVFGDGIRCISGSLLRMGSAVAQAGVASWPVGPDSISVRGNIPAPGATRYYYVYYRDVLTYCNAATYNLTDTQRIVWAP